MTRLTTPASHPLFLFKQIELAHNRVRYLQVGLTILKYLSLFALLKQHKRV